MSAIGLYSGQARFAASRRFTPSARAFNSRRSFPAVQLVTQSDTPNQRIVCAKPAAVPHLRLGELFSYRDALPLAGYLRPWPTVRPLITGLLVLCSRLSAPSFDGSDAAVWIELYANEYKCQAERVYICPASHIRKKARTRRERKTRSSRLSIR